MAGCIGEVFRNFKIFGGKIVLERKKEKKGFIYIGSFLTASLAIMIVLIALHIYPFGEKSILIWDMKIQYVDFFCYLKDVLTGNASIAYSFSKSLGGSLVAMFGYYLSSPLNFLVLFFEKDAMQNCLVLITILKIGLCGLTFSVFLKNRFEKLNSMWIISLSCAYALSQYVVSQMSNIMWLDGVYMLPLMMLGVYKLVKKNRKTLLYSTVALSIVFNWYTGYMNCLFIPFYFLYECLIKKVIEKEKYAFKYYVKRFMEFCMIEGLAVLTTMVLFLPVILGLRQGKGEAETNIFEFAVNGKFLDIFRGFVIGSPGNNVAISLFCGTIVLIGCFAYFRTKEIRKYEKIISALFLFFLIAGIYFKPLENVWNGFRFVYSYMYRFSYVIIAFLIYLCAYVVNREKNIEKKVFSTKIILGISVLFLLLDGITAFNQKKLWVEIAILFLILCVILLKNEKIRRFSLCIILAGEMILNGILVTKPYYHMENQHYVSYVQEQQKQLDELEKYDGTIFYRIEQTLNREMNEEKTTAYFDESLVYGYNGVSHYNSAYNREVSEFISNLGYSDTKDITIYDEPILSSDSLLGVKYLLSEEEYPGWKKISEIEKYNDKLVYENPYALSLGIVVKNIDSEKIKEDNPFLYQNKIFSKIVGRNVQLFKKIEPNIEVREDGIAYTIPGTTESKGIVYGYGRFTAGNLNVYVNDIFKCKYQKWLSYLTMSIGEKSRTNTIFFQGLTQENLNDEVEFYYLDMQMFENVISELQTKQAELEYLKNGEVKFSTYAKNGESLLTTIPYEKGWEIYVNGKEVKGEKAAGIFLEIPLQNGENDVELRYHVLGIKAGSILSIGALGIFVSWMLYLNRKNKRQNKGGK